MLRSYRMGMTETHICRTRTNEVEMNPDIRGVIVRRLAVALFVVLSFCNVCSAQTLRLEVQRTGAGRSYSIVSRYADGIVTHETEEL